MEARPQKESQGIHCGVIAVFRRHNQWYWVKSNMVNPVIAVATRFGSRSIPATSFYQSHFSS